MTTTPMPELPPLPAVSFLGDDISYGYDREDMHTYAKAYARAAIEAATEQGKRQPPYPEGDVAGFCVCGSWPGGKCLKCPWTSATPQGKI